MAQKWEGEREGGTGLQRQNPDNIAMARNLNLLIFNSYTNNF